MLNILVFTLRYRTVLAARIERALAHDLLLEELHHGAQLVHVRGALHDSQEGLRVPRGLFALQRETTIMDYV